MEVLKNLQNSNNHQVPYFLWNCQLDNNYIVLSIVDVVNFTTVFFTRVIIVPLKQRKVERQRHQNFKLPWDISHDTIIQLTYRQWTSIVNRCRLNTFFFWLQHHEGLLSPKMEEESNKLVSIYPFLEPCQTVLIIIFNLLLYLELCYLHATLSI